MMVDDLANILEIGTTSTRNLLKELHKDGYVKKAKYGKKIGYSANLTKIDEHYVQ